MLIGGYWIWVVVALTAALGGPVDEAVGDDRRNFSPALRVLFSANLFLTLPLLIVFTIVFLHYWTPGDPLGFKAWLAGFGLGFTSTQSFFAAGPVAGATVAAAIFFSMTSITVAHELIHWTNNRYAMAIGRALLGFTVSTSFAIAHVYGHHRTVGTLVDHATARRGEGVFAFTVRCSLQQNVNAFNYEAGRLKRKGLNPWSWHNRLLTSYGYPLVIVIAAWLIAGWGGLLGYAIAVAIAKLVHRAIDYTQHYGIVRVPGSPIAARHSWDCHRALSNGLFYNLPRHSDHHVYASRRGWELRAIVNDAPMMPYGYNTMLLVALIPPLFHRLIDPRLAEWDRTLASDAERAIIRERGWEITTVPAPVAADAKATS